MSGELLPLISPRVDGSLELGNEERSQIWFCSISSRLLSPRHLDRSRAVLWPQICSHETNS
jgi:hypothetical protein